MNIQPLIKRFFPDPVKGRHNVAILSAVFIGIAIVMFFVCVVLVDYTAVRFPLWMGIVLIGLCVVPVLLSIICVLIWIVMLLFFTMNYSLKSFMLAILAYSACLTVMVRAPQPYNAIALAGLLALTMFTIFKIAQKENSRLGRKI